MKVQQRGRTTEIEFGSRRESATVLRAMGLVHTADHLDGIEDLVALPGMTAAAVHRLRGIGVTTLSELIAEDPKIIAYVAEVSPERVAQWRSTSLNGFLSDVTPAE